MSQIVETAQTEIISILPLNNVAYTPGQKCIFLLEPDLGLIKAARGESYLAITVRNDSTNLRWMFAHSGQCLIQDVAVFSIATGQQLEQISNYNQIMMILDQYGNVVKDTQQSLEGMVAEPYALEYTGGVAGAVQRRRVWGDGSADYVMNSITSPIQEDGTLIPLGYQICIPLKLGIFSCFQEEKLTPVMSLGGLRIEITLAPVQPTCVPISPYVNGVVYDMVGTPVAGSAGVPVVQGSALDTLWLQGTNTVEQTGLTVGQTIQFESGVSSQSTTITALGVSGAAGTCIQITTADACNTGGVSGRFQTLATTWQANLSYAIDDIQFRVLRVVPTDGSVLSLSKPLSYAFRTVTTFFDSIPTGERRHQTEIFSVSSRAKSIMAMIFDSTLEDDDNAPAYYRGTDPDTLNLNSVQFFINNRLYPLQAYDPRRQQDRPQTLNELQKAFSAMGTPAMSFGDASGYNLDSYSNVFLVCRELARDSGGNYVYDLRSAQPSIRLGFSATRTNIQKVNTFVWEDRVVEVNGAGMAVII